MNIGIDLRSLGGEQLTGVGQYTAGLVRALIKQKERHRLLGFANSAKQSPVQDFFLPEDIQVKVGRIPNKLLHTSIALASEPKLDKGLGEIDVFFSPNIHFTAISPNVKHVLTVHDLTFLLFPEWYSAKRRLWHKFVRAVEQIKNADALVVPSNHTKKDLIDHLDVREEKITVISPAAQTEDPAASEIARVRNKYDLSKPYILFLGTIEPRKNIRALIAGYKRSQLFQRGIELIIAGASGWKNKDILRDIAETEHVRYLGFVPEKDKASLIAAAHVFAYPSLYEGFGLPVLDAMVLGTPVLCSHYGSLPEVTDGCARLVHPYDVNDIAQGLSELATDDKLRNRCTEKGSARAAKYNWETAATSFFSLCESL